MNYSLEKLRGNLKLQKHKRRVMLCEDGLYLRDLCMPFVGLGSSCGAAAGMNLTEDKAVPFIIGATVLTTVVGTIMLIHDYKENIYTDEIKSTKQEINKVKKLT